MRQINAKKLTEDNECFGNCTFKENRHELQKISKGCDAACFCKSRDQTGAIVELLTSKQATVELSLIHI